MSNRSSRDMFGCNFSEGNLSLWSVKGPERSNKRILSVKNSRKHSGLVIYSSLKDIYSI